MKIGWWVWHALSMTTIVFLIGSWSRRAAPVGDEFPNRPIQVVVPYAAGGGSDTFVRIVSSGITEDNLLPVPLVILNQDGGIGTIGSREVKNASPDGYKILCHHNAIITAKLAGTVTYGPEAFEPIAMTGEMAMVILVRSDSPFQNLTDLLEAAKEEPNTIRFAANKGAPAFFATLQLQKTVPGAEFTIVSSGGGADRYTKIIGGHLEAGIFSLSEYLDFRRGADAPPDQDVRAIALLSEQRHESIPEVPTATELGSPVLLNNANYWWAPKGTPPEILTFFADLLEKAIQNETVRSELRRIRVDPVFDRGESLSVRIEQTVNQFESVAEQKQMELPNFPLYLGVILAALFLWMLVDSARLSNSMNLPQPQLADPITFVPRPRVAIASLILLATYIQFLGTPWLPFAPLTSMTVILIGGTMLLGGKNRPASHQLIVLAQLGILTGFGIDYAFTELLGSPLPS